MSETQSYTTIENITSLMSGFTVEITPKGAEKIEDFRHHLATGTKVYVTALPDTDFADTVKTCVKLAEQGMQAIPHITARSIDSKGELESRIKRITEEAGVTQVLDIAGADKIASGPFEDSASMLETGFFDKYGIKSIGIAGHPEGSPDIAHPMLREYGRRKIDYAQVTDIQLYLVTQFVFQAEPIINWLERIRSENNQLPLVIGIPGIASLKSLIGHAKACGIGPSMTVLTKQAKNIHKLLTLQEPNELIRQLADYSATHPQSNIAGLHIFPLGGLLPSAKWAYKVAEGQIELTKHAFKTVY